MEEFCEIMTVNLIFILIFQNRIALVIWFWELNSSFFMINKTCAMWIQVRIKIIFLITRIETIKEKNFPPKLLSEIQSSNLDLKD